MTLSPIPYRQLLLETLIVLGVALMALAGFTDLSAYSKLSGLEMEFLTSSAHTAALALRAEGYIPLWQPLLGEGRPLLESPFSFVLNPISVGGALWTGDGLRGVKLSVIGYGLLAAGGGWFMGRAFGAGAIGRVLLALLMVGKGNMVATLGVGHYQLGVSQAYMPYIFGAAYLILRGHRHRWSVILLGMAVALQFLAGNVWHVLPTLLSLGAFVAVFVARYPFEREGGTERAILMRLAAAALITLGLSAAVLVPLWVNRAYIGGQIPVTDGGTPAPILPQLLQYIRAQPLVNDLGLTYGALQSRYNYTVPWWLLLLALLPLGPTNAARPRRLWWLVGGLFVVFTLWGLGGMPPFRWAYEMLPGLGRWRFVGRAYATASVWLALFVALRTDAIWAALGSQRRIAAHAFAVLVVFSGVFVALYNWREWAQLVSASEPNTTCLAWLYAQRTDGQPLAVYQGGYGYVTSFLNANVRQTPIEAAYRPLPVPYTLYPQDLRQQSLPRYALPVRQRDLAFLQANGYRPIPTAPLHTTRDPTTGQPLQLRCAWEKPDTLPYSYRVPLRLLDTANIPLTAERVTPIRPLVRASDYIGLVVQGAGGDRAVVVAGEVAYPGWRVWVDGSPAPLESVGGYIGVRLPLSTQDHTVLFVYRPRLVIVCLWVTLITAVGCILALLRIDRARPALTERSI